MAASLLTVRVVLPVLLASCVALSPGRDRPTGWPEESGEPTDGEPTDPTDPTATAGTLTAAHLVEEPGAPCLDPSLRDADRFRVTAMPYVEPRPWYGLEGSGVGVGDFDEDGALDVLVLGKNKDELIVRTSEGYVERADWRDPAIDLTSGFGAAVADHDADGDLDIFVTRYKKPNVLLQNDGQGWFVDVAAALGVAGDPEHYSTGASWSDFDNDGDLDLYVTGHGKLLEATSHADYLYANQGDGTFSDVSDLVPDEVHVGYGFAPLFLDVDGDGWRDLYVSTDHGNVATESQLLWNREGRFELDDNRVGLDRTMCLMGIGVGDVDEDGGWDLLLTGWAELDLMMSSSELGLWLDYSDAVGLVPDDASDQVVPWGSELADLDNDTLLDALVMFGYLKDDSSIGRVEQPNGLWIQGADGAFVDQAAEWGFDDRDVMRGVGVMDLDQDGWLDVIAPSHGGPTKIYAASCGEGSWLEVALEMPGTLNLDAVGAVVELEVDGRTLRRPMLAGGTAYGTGLAPIVHFGLGEAEAVDRLVVRWPDGARSAIGPVTARQKVTVVRD